MKKLNSKFSLGRIGILGGGQLAKMTALEAKKLGFHITILDPSVDAPAASVSDDQIVAGFQDAKKLQQLVRQVDVTTFDIEQINVDSIRKLSSAGHVIQPSPNILKIIQDKWIQKQFLVKRGIPVSSGVFVSRPNAESFRKFGFPLVQKLTTGGYDGRAVAILGSTSDLPKALKGPSLLEEFVDVKKELAVMVARTKKGEMRTYPVVEMVFDSRANILDLLLAPAGISKDVAHKAQRLAKKCIDRLGGVGIFGVEMFLSKQGVLYVNEIAPRPHNSGHYTIEACVTSQFEQHVRAIMNLPLGDTTQLRPAAMMNLLGTKTGVPVLSGLHRAMAIEGVSIHIYGKTESRPFRKLGHVTALGNSIEEARAKINKVKKLLHFSARAQ